MSEREVELDTVRLIELVKRRPQLWDRTLNEYKERRPTRESWNHVCRGIDPAFDLRTDSEQLCLRERVLKRWTNVRDCWIRAYKRELEANVRGAGNGSREPRPRRYLYFKKMLFLKKIFEKGGTNFSMSEASVDQGFALKTEPQDELTSEPSMEEPPPLAWACFQEEPVIKLTTSRQEDECESTVPVVQGVSRGADDEPALMFFKGVLPLVRGFGNDQMIDFQIGVLQLIKNINDKSQ